MQKNKGVDEQIFNYNLVRLENDESEKENYKEINYMINQGYHKVKLLVEEAKFEHLRNTNKEMKNE